jgi:hypothetical protein
MSSGSQRIHKLFQDISHPTQLGDRRQYCRRPRRHARGDGPTMRKARAAAHPGASRSSALYATSPAGGSEEGEVTA